MTSDNDLAIEIIEILKRYRVNLHWQASSGGPRRYAVWAGELGTLADPPKQITEPASHAEANEARTGLIMNDLLEIIHRERAAAGS